MKFGIRKPNYKARFKARTTGKLKRKMKKAVNPLYGKKGMGFIKDPKKSIKSSIYHRTTVGVPSLLPKSQPKQKSAKPPKAAPVRNTSAPRTVKNKPFIAKYSPKTYNACGILLYIVGGFLALIGVLGFAAGGIVFLILGVLAIVWGRKYRKISQALTYPAPVLQSPVPYQPAAPVQQVLLPSRTLSVSQFDIHKISTLRQLTDFVAIDTETTGLSPDKDRVIDLAVATIKDRKIIDSYSSLINPRCHIPEEASRVNHIYDMTVAAAPDFAAVAPQLLARISGQIIIGYNVKFDLDFLGYELGRIGLSVIASYIDVLPLSRRAFPGLKNYKLETIALHLGLLNPGSVQDHRALSDAELTVKVFFACVDTIVSAHEKNIADSRERRAQADAERREKYAASPLLDKTFAFTGDFTLGRENIESMAEKVGALTREKVSSKLNYLVVGDTRNLPDWAIERKLNKVDEFIASGNPIEKINEAQYVQMINSAIKSINNSQSKEMN